jgi:1-acyl-sn-glycerol-3-phosphate acyltransferase
MPKGTLGRDPFAGLISPEEPAKKRKRGAKSSRRPKEKPAPPEAAAPPEAPAPPEPPHEEAAPPPDEPPPSQVPSSVTRAFGELARTFGFSLGRTSTDEFGYDPAVDALFRPIVDLLYERYFRVACIGSEHVPENGRVLFVANHSGALPLDGLILRHALELKIDRPRRIRVLTEEFFGRAPLFLTPLLFRTGMVPASQENALRLLEREECVGVFPEGVRGLAKPFAQRYHLQRFGRGGFIRVALKARAPIVPVAVVGGEESFPILANIKALGKPLGLPFLPVTPTFPWLGPIGLMPLPTRWSLHIGEPLDLGRYGPEHAENEEVVEELAKRVRDRLQEMLDAARAWRRSIWFR